MHFVCNSFGGEPNLKTFSRSSSGKRKSINEICLGPIHTLHKPNGELATKNWWYDTNYIAPVRIHNRLKELPDFLEFFYNYRRLLRTSRYSEDLKLALLRYSEALDLINWEDSYLKLWRVLEQLTNTGKSGYNITIKRASFLFKDKEYTRNILNHLRDYRNRSVHSDSFNNDIEVLLFQLKRFVEILINFHVYNPLRFKSICEFADFMDLPDSIEILQKRIKLLRLAEKFQNV